MKSCQDRAAELLVDSRSEGSHGFRGIRLKVWRRQREAIKDALGSITLDYLTLEEFATGFLHCCPSDLGESDGTADGYDWVCDCHALLAEVATRWVFISNPGSEYIGWDDPKGEEGKE